MPGGSYLTPGTQGNVSSRRDGRRRNGAPAHPAPGRAQLCWLWQEGPHHEEPHQEGPQQVPPQPPSPSPSPLAHCPKLPMLLSGHSPAWGSWSCSQNHLVWLCLLLRPFLLGLFSHGSSDCRDRQDSESSKKTGKRQVLWISIFNTANSISVIIFRKKIQSVSWLPFQYLQLFPCRCFQGPALRGRRRQAGLSPRRLAQEGEGPARGKTAQSRCPWPCVGMEMTTKLCTMWPTSPSSQQLHHLLTAT